MASDRYELLDMSKQQTLLEQIIQQAQHFFMRRRTEYVLDTIAKEVTNHITLFLEVPHYSIYIIVIQIQLCIYLFCLGERSSNCVSLERPEQPHSVLRENQHNDSWVSVGFILSMCVSVH